MQENREIIIYTGVSCSKCPVLKKMLQQENIPYTEKDVMKNMSEARSLRIRSLPFVVKCEDGEVVESGSVSPSAAVVADIQEFLKGE